MNLENASVVLTGASGGIGAELARLLVQSGARVLLVARSGPRLLSLATQIQPPGTGRERVDALAVDITTSAGRRAVLDAARARGVNVLVNNAAVPCFGSACQSNASELEQLIQTNVTAPLALTAGLLGQLMAQKHALILNVGSVLGEIGVPGYAAYGASKAALRQYSQALRRELAGSGVNVLYAAPRAVSTPFNDDRVVAFNQATGTQADSPAQVAQRLLKMLQTETVQQTFGFPESLATPLNRLFPVLFDKVFGSHRRALATVTPPVNQPDH